MAGGICESEANLNFTLKLRADLAQIEAATAYGSQAETETRSKETSLNARLWTAMPKSAVPRTRMPRSTEFYEGNYDIALMCVRLHLAEHDLWSNVARPYPSFISLPQDQAQQLERDDMWAVDIILPQISRDINRRWTFERPLSQLLVQLKRACEPFRFLDLPREIMQRVYGLLVSTGRELCEFDSYEGVGRSPWIDRLCSVSQEFSSEILKIHHSGNTFEAGLYGCNGPELLERWAEVIGMESLQHLRSLEVVIEWHKEFRDMVKVTYDDVHGLQAWTWDSEETRCEDHLATEFCKKMERRKLEQGWKGTGVIECFINDTDALREAVGGPFEPAEDEEPIDEWDAYQVAYGRPPIIMISTVW